MKRGLLALIAALAFALAPVGLQPARAQRGGGGSGGAPPSFDQLVDQDVGKGYYTADQGQTLKGQYDAAIERANEAADRYEAQSAAYVSLAKSGNAQLLADSQQFSRTGLNVDDPNEAANQVYDAAHLQLQTANAQIELLSKAYGEVFSEVDKVVQARNGLLQANPSIPTSVRNSEMTQAAKAHDVLTRTFDDLASKLKYQLNDAQRTLDSEKTQIVEKIKKVIEDNKAKYGSDTSKWPKATPTPPPARSPPTRQAQNGGAGGAAPPSAPTPAPSSSGNGRGASSGGGTRSGQGAGVDSSGTGDPALSANRNGNVQGNAPGAGQQRNGSSSAASSHNTPANPNAASHAGSALSQGASSAGQNARRPPPPQPPQISQAQLQAALNTRMNGPQSRLPLPGPPAQNEQGVDGPVLNDAPPSNGSGASTQQGDQPNDQVLAPTPGAEPGLPAARRPSNGRGAPGNPSDAASDPSFDANRNNPAGRNGGGAGQAGSDVGGAAGEATNGTGQGAVVGAQAAGSLPTQPDLASNGSNFLNRGREGVDSNVNLPASEGETPANSPTFPVDPKNPLLRPGNMHFYDDGADPTQMPVGQLPALSVPPDLTAVDFGVPLTLAMLAPIYQDYLVTPGQNGSNVFVQGSLQVQTPGSVMIMPSMQIPVPSFFGNVPSWQVNIPSQVMMSPDFAPALCGH